MLKGRRMINIPNSLKQSALFALCASSLGLASSFALEYDQEVEPDVIFGSGNANGSFTVGRAFGIELGLRGKLRHNAAGSPENTFNSNGDGTYSFDAGVAPTQSFPTAEWSFEWSINTDLDDTGTLDLADLSYTLDLDIDPNLGIDFVTFDPIRGINPNFGEVRWDHGIGDNNTANGDGGNFVADTATYASAIAANNVAQNSWKPHWFFPGFDPTVDATYDLSLSAYAGFSFVDDPEDPQNGQIRFEHEHEPVLLARTNIQIIVGNGGSPVPDSGSAALMLSAALLGLLGVRRFSASKR